MAFFRAARACVTQSGKAIKEASARQVRETSALRSSQVIKLFNLHEDSAEQSDLTEEQPEIAETLRSELSDFLEVPKEPSASERDQSPAPELSEEEVSRLKALGYL